MNSTEDISKEKMHPILSKNLSNNDCKWPMNPIIPIFPISVSGLRPEGGEAADSCVPAWANKVNGDCTKGLLPLNPPEIIHNNHKKSSKTGVIGQKTQNYEFRHAAAQPALHPLDHVARHPVDKIAHIDESVVSRKEFELYEQHAAEKAMLEQLVDNERSMFQYFQKEHASCASERERINVLENNVKMLNLLNSQREAAAKSNKIGLQQSEEKVSALKFKLQNSEEKVSALMKELKEAQQKITQQSKILMEERDERFKFGNEMQANMHELQELKKQMEMRRDVYPPPLSLENQIDQLDSKHLEKMKRYIKVVIARRAREEVDRAKSAAVAQVLEERFCNICEERSKNTVLNCGHVCCRECSVLIQRCHLCSAPIVSRLNFYH